MHTVTLQMTIAAALKRCVVCHSDKGVNQFECGRKQCKSCRSRHYKLNPTPIRETRCCSVCNTTKPGRDFRGAKCKPCVKMERQARNASKEPPATQECRTCKYVKTASEFYRSALTTSLLTHECKTCNSHKNAQLRAWVNSHKKECAECQFSDSTDALEFAHLDGTTKARRLNGKRSRGIGEIQDMTKLVKELDLVRVLCSFCHRLETQRQRNDADRIRASMKSRSRKRQDDIIKTKARIDFANAEKIRRSCCVDCGKIVTPASCVAFDFDHVDLDSKVASVSHLCNKLRPLEDIKNEMDKCVLRCCNCHRIKSRLLGEFGGRSSWRSNRSSKITPR